MRNKNARIVVCLICLLGAPHAVRAAQEAMLGYANISARVSPLWIAREKGYRFANHCLFREGNPSGEMDGGTGRVMRNYHLYRL